jgi:predicted ATPase
MAIHYLLRGAITEALQAADALITLSREQGFAQLLAHGMLWRAAALSWLDLPAKAIPLLKEALAARLATGNRITHPGFSMQLVLAYLRAGGIETGLAVVSELLAWIERTGERLSEAALWLRRGQLLLARAEGDENEAELSLQKALAVSRQQHIKLTELATATALAQLWQRQGKRRTARELLEPIYAWFTEGFELPVLRDARAALDELSKP